MSGFLSDKFLRARAVEDGLPVDHDLPCKVCGYNLRGLPRNRPCPECGAGSVDSGAAGGLRSQQRGGLVDIICHRGETERDRWWIGLTLAVACIGAVMLLRFVRFSGAFIGGLPDELIAAYPSIHIAIGVVWMVAVVLIMPPVIAEIWPRKQSLRTMVLLTQPFWIIGSVLLLAYQQAAAGTNMETMLWLGHYAARSVAGIGVLVMAALLIHIAAEAELEPAWQRINTAAWILPIPTIIAQFFVGLFPWIGVAILGLVLVWWAWMLLLALAGLWQMRQHAAWARRHAGEMVGRLERIAETRAELDEQVEAKIRALPQTPSEPIAVVGAKKKGAGAGEGDPNAKPPRGPGRGRGRGRTIWDVPPRG